MKSFTVFYLIQEVNCSHNRGWDLTEIDEHNRLRTGLAFITKVKPAKTIGNIQVDIKKWY